MGRKLEILGLSVLAFVAVMAVSASAAQANWQNLLNKVKVSSVTTSIKSTKALSLTIPGLGLEISCKASSGSFSMSGTTILAGSGEVLLTGCKDTEFAACEVHSTGKPNENINASGEGVVGMEGEKVYVELKSKAGEAFTSIEYSGAKCPLEEIEGSVTGAVSVETLEPLNDLTLHVGHVVRQNLLFAGMSMMACDATCVQPLVSPLISIMDQDPTKTLALHLVGL